MNMNWLESIFYGLISGLSEILPISAPAHQQLFRNLSGITGFDPLRELFIYIAVLAALLLSNRSTLVHMVQERQLSQRSRRSRHHSSQTTHDQRLLNSALLPMLFSMLVFRYLFKDTTSLLGISIFILINGVILYIPNRMVQSNKDARAMSKFDSLLIGCSAGLSVFSGISRIGCTYSAAIIRGADKKHALQWSFILSITALIYLSVLCFISLFGYGQISFASNILTYILSTLGAFGGAITGIIFMRYLVVQPNHSGFSYYCWGVALFAFIVYLIIG